MPKTLRVFNYNPETDAVMYLCPQCGEDVPEAKIARDELFCSKRCQVAFKRERPQTYGADIANYRRWVLGLGIGQGKRYLLPADAEGHITICEWPKESGRFLDAFDRVLTLSVFLGKLAAKEGREPIETERVARLRRIAKSGREK